MPFHTVPLLDINNGERVINQSLAIARLLAKRFGKLTEMKQAGCQVLKVLFL